MDEIDDGGFGETALGEEALITTFMSDGLVTVPPTASLRQVATIIADASVGCVVVGSTDDVDGVISERDIVRAVADGLDLDATTVAEVESKTLVWASSNATVGSVAEEMMQDYVRHVLVRDGGRVVGIVSMRDVLSAYCA
ncbi:MAG TPA: CBS domain-containing protein [Ilumatobacteraceae bacterium]|nr:CBS domain-containing protein [Ilumatobacteraceae bacterium]